MVLSYYFYKIPYSLIWRYKQWRGTLTPIVFYCGSSLDLIVFEPIQKYLKPLSIVAKNKQVQQDLSALGIQSVLLPQFPKGVIMARQAAYKFPYSAVTKICIRHGAYHFKRLASSKSYNLLDAYFFSSKADLSFAKQAGITSGVAIGFPKLDRFFDGSFTQLDGEQLKKSLALDTAKKTLLFTATWNESGVSAIHLWYQKLEQLTDLYNVLVTVHPWTSKDITQCIEQTTGVTLISGFDVIPYIAIADVCIGDTSSILAECCALDKAMITFKTKEHKRSVPHVMNMIKNISWQVDSFEALVQKIPYAIKNKEHHKETRKEANLTMFDDLDGLAGRRAANEIIKLLPELKKSE